MREKLDRLLFGLAVLCVAAALSCGRPPDAATGGGGAGQGAKPDLQGNIVELTPEMATRADIAIQPVARGEFRTFRDFPATIHPNERALAEITTLVRGKVIDVYADVGQEVKADDLLAMLYSGELGLAQSAYLKAQAKLYVAEQAFRRARFLLKEKVIGEAEAQRREAELFSARAEARESKDRLVLLGMEEKDIRRLDRDQKIASYVPIDAPFAGRIIARNIVRGEVVETTDKLFVVADLSEVWVMANIPEKDIPYIQPHRADHTQLVEVRVAAYPNEVFRAKITYVGDVLDPTTRTMRVRLELANAQGRLKPEMFATVRVYSEIEPGVLLVPEVAVQRDRDRTFVFVQRAPHVFEVRDVSLGDSNGELVKVQKGLTEGEPVVIKEAFLLKSQLLKKDI
jgi:cobalt-zinc-cadmium efflux system membrane fusion protein